MGGEGRERLSTDPRARGTEPGMQQEPRPCAPEVVQVWKRCGAASSAVTEPSQHPWKEVQLSPTLSVLPPAPPPLPSPHPTPGLFPPDPNQQGSAAQGFS